MNNEIIELIEKRRNELRNIIIRKGIFATKKEKAILENYEKMLLNQYKKLEKM